MTRSRLMSAPAARRAAAVAAAAVLALLWRRRKRARTLAVVMPGFGEAIEIALLGIGEIVASPAHRLTREFPCVFSKFANLVYQILDLSGDQPGVLVSIKQFNEIRQFITDILLQIDRFADRCRLLLPVGSAGAGLGFRCLFKLGACTR